jgi:hypothetical protein
MSPPVARRRYRMQANVLPARHRPEADVPKGGHIGMSDIVTLEDMGKCTFAEFASLVTTLARLASTV